MRKQGRVWLRQGAYGVLVAVTLMIAVSTAEQVTPLISGCGALVVGAGLLPMVANPRRAWLVSAAATVAGVSSLAVTLVHQDELSTNDTANWWTAEVFAMLVLLSASVRRAPVRTASGIAVLLTAALAMGQLRFLTTYRGAPHKPDLEDVSVLLIIAALVAVAIGCYLRNLDARSRAALAAERRVQRMNLARDLHDYAAHDVTTMVVLVEAAQVMAEEDPRQALALLPEIGAAGAQALAAMDQTVRLLAHSDADAGSAPDSGSGRGSDSGSGPGVGVGAGVGVGPGGGPSRDRPARVRPRRDLSELPSLAERFTRTGSPEAVLDLADGLPEDLPAEVSATGYRVVVEALTNVRRHAATATKVEIALCVVAYGTGRALRVQVTDDAPCPQPAPALAGRGQEAGGLGIAGLTEQVRRLGGELSAGPRRPAGWRVTALLPLGAARHREGPGGLPPVPRHGSAHGSDVPHAPTPLTSPRGKIRRTADARTNSALPP
ncbi:histidine kinase [Streptomyces sp. MST-110588]|uniref:sensor histidine kinase n=1 Tax=Streptomyces sp. MST-110588 TaxID=2833628 RepID=UPI001F5C882C|nr:histidine kinase [Streptomyces sp. MST-110588]UNO41585.1 hypothetical protein KGS77_21020 [Streptomyces sp. MST-110588]